MINIQKVHVYSAAGAFLAKRYSTNHGKYDKQIHLFSAAGAFSTNHGKYENIKKS